MIHRWPVLFSFVISMVLTSCTFSHDDSLGYHGRTYPPTSMVRTIFLASQAPGQCRVIAELLATLPANKDGAWIQQALEKEAKAHGADFLLIGQSRQMEDDIDLTFAYYGPEMEYPIQDNWCGWKSGFDTWEEQGALVGIGAEEWGNNEVRFPFPLMIQTAFLRCQK